MKFIMASPRLYVNRDSIAALKIEELRGKVQTVAYTEGGVRFVLAEGEYWNEAEQDLRDLVARLEGGE